MSHLQPIAFGVSFNLILQCQSDWSLFKRTRQKRRKKLENQSSFEPIASGVSFLQSQIAIDDLVRYVSFATFR